MHSTRPDIVGEIRAEMARQAVSVGKLSEATGLTMATLYRRLSRTEPTSLTVAELQDICGALQISVTTLISRAESAAA